MQKKKDIGRAAQNVLRYRACSREQRDDLWKEVRTLIGKSKDFSNWRDVSAHTFALFSLGTAMIRHDDRLWLTDRWVDSIESDDNASTELASRIALLPLAPSEELLVPPVAPASNDGTDAEALIAKVLTSQGWRVAFYTNRRGHGFDLWARKGDDVMLVEVKSSTSTLDSVALTAGEYAAAQMHSGNYVLACVENIGSESPHVHFVVNPIASIKMKSSTTTQHTFARSVWIQAAQSQSLEGFTNTENEESY